MGTVHMCMFTSRMYCTYICMYSTFLYFLDTPVLCVLQAHDTVKPAYKDHPRDQENVDSVDRWSLYRGTLV